MAIKEETVVVRRIVADMESIGAYGFKYWGGGRYTVSGLPDLHFVYQGLYVAIEVKTQTGKADPLQIHKLKEYSKAGAISILVYGLTQWAAIFEYMTCDFVSSYCTRIVKLNGRYETLFDNDTGYLLPYNYKTEKSEEYAYDTIRAIEKLPT